MDELLSPGQLDTYLQRVGMPRAPAVDASGLVALHRARFFAIPFENFEVLSARRIDLESLKAIF